MERVIQAAHIVIDSKKPKTIASLAHKNTEQMIKRGDPRIKTKTKAKNPWWRKDRPKPVNIRGWDKKKIQRYIATGKK